MNKDIMANLIERGAVLKRLQAREVTQQTAGLQLQLSERQVRRLYKKYRAGGAKSLIHGNHGKASPRKLSAEIETQVIEWLKEHGPDFGATFAREKLEEYLKIKVSVGTIRAWCIKHGLHSPRYKKSKSQFMRRKRKQLFGHMLQMDGSPHDWFEGRRAKCMLLTCIDDATGKIMARFSEEETTEELMILCKDYIKRYGIPHMAYTDKGVPYKVNTGNPEGDKLTQLGRAFEQLGIEHVHAHSPQAKGRVERNHGTNQDRLIKEMRLRSISTLEAANKYLDEEYLPDFNQRFVIKPAGTQDAHRPLGKINLDNVFSHQETRVMQNDGVVQFEKHIFQITKNRIYAQPKSKILVRKHLDGSITLWSQEIKLGYDKLDSKQQPVVLPSQKKINHIPRTATQANKNWINGKYAPYKLLHDHGGDTAESTNNTD